MTAAGKIGLMASPPLNLRIVRDSQELARTAADIFVAQAKVASSLNSRFTVVLSGGNTPKAIYELLATNEFQAQLSWDKIHLFWGDERNVPPENKESNYRMAWDAMLSRLPIPKENIHRIHTELLSPEIAAIAYEDTIRGFFSVKSRSDKPCFDLVFLGIGTDGHTLSLFPDGKPGAQIGEEDPDRLVIAPWVPHLNAHRISLTPAAINSSSQVVFLVSGVEKASIIKNVFDDTRGGAHYPARAIQPRDGHLTWLVDRPAATHWLASSTLPKNEGLK